MPGKSRRKRGKFTPQSKTKKGRQNRPSVVARQQAVTPTQQPVSPSKIPAPPAKAVTPVAKSTAVRYPYIAAELWTIGILAVIMLVILAVLASVLS
jgi:hypothetical protein